MTGCRVRRRGVQRLRDMFPKSSKVPILSLRNLEKCVHSDSPHAYVKPKYQCVYVCLSDALWRALSVSGFAHSGILDGAAKRDWHHLMRKVRNLSLFRSLPLKLSCAIWHFCLLFPTPTPAAAASRCMDWSGISITNTRCPLPTGILIN